MPGEVIVTIDPVTNEVTVEVKGMRGKTCKEVTKHLEEALGQVKSTKLKPEYYDNTQVKTTTKVGR